MKKISEFKQEAYASLEGNWGKFVLITFVYFLITIGLTNSVSFVLNDSALYSTSNLLTLYKANIAQIIIAIALFPLEWSFTVVFLRHLRNLPEGKKVSSLFSGYKDFTRILLTCLLAKVYVFLWTLLLIVPGIIKGYSYSMTYYILLDNPEMKNNKAIEKSMELMKGNKMKLFLLDLSFIGWFILGILTLGIGLLWVYPYWCNTRAAFYENLIRETEDTELN